MSNTITLYEVIQTHVDRLQDNIWTSIPAVVTSYDASKQAVDVLIELRQLLVSTGEDLAPIRLSGVPVVFPGGGGGVITFPLTSGDKVLLTFSKYSIDAWKEGTAGVVGDNRQQDINDAVAIPGLVDLRTNLSPSDSDVEVKFNNSSIILRSSGDVEINPSGNTIINSDVTVEGSITATGDVTAGTISLQQHTHGGVRSGGAQTLPPT